MIERLGWIVLATMLCCSQVQGQAKKEMDYLISSSGKAISFENMVTEIKRANVVFVGENHDDKHAHAFQLSLLRAMHTQNPRIALSMEMFERDVQGVLDEYLTGQITEASFLQASRPWANYKSDYRPLVEFCRENKLPVIAANAPRRYVGIVSRKGQEALRELPAASRAFLAPLPYSMDIPKEYDQQLHEIFDGNHSQGAGSGTPVPSSPAMPSTENMIQAQALWDASMQDAISRFLKRNRGTQVIQINGAMHSDGRFGIVDRLRKAAPRLKVLVITVKPDADYPQTSSEKYMGLADFVVVVPKESTASKE